MMIQYIKGIIFATYMLQKGRLRSAKSEPFDKICDTISLRSVIFFLTSGDDYPSFSVKIVK